MIQKNDVILLLTELQEKGIDIKNHLKMTISYKDIPLDTLQFINDNTPLDVVDFYNHLRENHNKKKSELYGNIMKEIDEPSEIITTLSAFMLQVSLFGRKLEDNRMFYKHIRADEITDVLNQYYKTYNINLAVKMLRLIKTDILLFEYIDGRRDLEGKVIKNKEN